MELGPGGMPIPEPLPCVNIGQMFGLLEIVRDNGGRMDVFALDRITDYDFGYTLSVVKACELLDFIDTPKNNVVLQPLGEQLLDLEVPKRKQMLKQQLLQLGTFAFITRILGEAKDHTLPKDVVQEELVMRLPTQDVEAMFKTAVAWGRFAELFEYDADGEMIKLDEGDAPASQPQPSGA